MTPDCRGVLLLTGDVTDSKVVAPLIMEKVISKGCLARGVTTILTLGGRDSVEGTEKVRLWAYVGGFAPVRAYPGGSQVISRAATKTPNNERTRRRVMQIGIVEPR